MYTIRDGRENGEVSHFFVSACSPRTGSPKPTSHHPGVAAPDLIPYLRDVLPEEAKELRVLEVAVLVYLRDEGLERALDALRRCLRLLLVTTFFFRFV